MRRPTPAPRVDPACRRPNSADQVKIDVTIGLYRRFGEARTVGRCAMAGKRDYGQFCGLAAGLNIVGERWTFLIVRELMISPVRFNEMIENLPGIGPNLLSERLRTLVEHGVIEQFPVPGDARGRLYQLTELGRELRGPLLALARWGMGFLGEEDGGAVRAEW